MKIISEFLMGVDECWDDKVKEWLANFLTDNVEVMWFLAVFILIIVFK